MTRDEDVNTTLVVVSKLAGKAKVQTGQASVAVESVVSVAASVVPSKPVPDRSVRLRRPVPFVDIEQQQKMIEFSSVTEGISVN